MKKLSIIILFSALLVIFAEKIHINFNDGSTLKEYDFRDIANIEIVEVPIGMVFVQGSTFWMGDEVGDLYSYNRPEHRVTVSDFEIGKFEVTQAEWEQYMPLEVTTYYGVGDFYPVYWVSWYEILVYCNKRSTAEGLTPCFSISDSTNPDDWGSVPFEQDSIWDATLCNWDATGYRLPSEAEWEYAARGGIYWAARYQYSGNDTINTVAWYRYNNFPYGTKLVGLKEPNQLGIYDMSGNVSELCWDWSDYPDYNYYQTCYDQGTVANPHGSDSGTRRIGRGGGWLEDDFLCRVAMRWDHSPVNQIFDVGFRIVRTP